MILARPPPPAPTSVRITGPTAHTRDDGGHTMVFPCAGVRLIGTACDGPGAARLWLLVPRGVATGAYNVPAVAWPPVALESRR